MSFATRIQISSVSKVYGIHEKYDGAFTVAVEKVLSNLPSELHAHAGMAGGSPTIADGFHQQLKFRMNQSQRNIHQYTGNPQ